MRQTLVGDKFGATFGTRLKNRLNKSATNPFWWWELLPWGLRRRLHCFLFHLLTFVLSWESSSKRKLERSESFGEFLLLPFSSMAGTLYSYHTLDSFSSHLHVVVLMKEDRDLVHAFFWCFVKKNSCCFKNCENLRLCSKHFFNKTIFWANIAYPML